MRFQFYKYQGTGNDFVVIDNRQLVFPKNNTKLIALLCDRKFGIGADGLILLESHLTANFTMVYFNADGYPGSMCGNGARCITHFARFLGIIENEASFEAADGMHFATIEGQTVSLRMQDVKSVTAENDHRFLNTGSPHHVQLVKDLKEYEVVTNGRRLRNELYGKEGANINFVERISDNTFAVRTYERGVENETLSCGTGVTAVAIALADMGAVDSGIVTLETPGGNLKVTFRKENDVYKDIQLIGPAVMVYKGEWE
jgi:diaminopimelate epimerase